MAKTLTDLDLGGERITTGRPGVFLEDDDPSGDGISDDSGGDAEVLLDLEGWTCTRTRRRRYTRQLPSKESGPGQRTHI